MIALPPSSLGGDHEIEAWSIPGVAATDTGAPGTVRGVTGADAALAGPAPAALEAVAVKVYAVPLVKPVTVHEVEAVEQVRPPGCERTTYESMG